MPLNMNTVGTGTGIGSGGNSSGGYSEIFDCIEDIKSKASSVQMSDFNVNTTEYHSHTAYWNSSDNPSKNPKLAYPLVKYKNELYLALSSEYVFNYYYYGFYKGVVSEGSQISYTEITTPFSNITSAFVYNNMLFIITGGYIVNALYMYDGTSFTLVTKISKDVSGLTGSSHSSDVSIYFKILPILYSDDDCKYLFISSYDSEDSYSSISMDNALCRITKENKFEVVIPATKQYWSNYQNMNFTTNITPEYVVLRNMLYYKYLYPSSANFIVLSISKNNSTYEYYFSLGYIPEADSTNGSMSLVNHIIKATVSPNTRYSNYYDLTFTRISNVTIDSISGVSIITGGGWTNEDYYKSRLYPLSYDFPDTYICILHRGYYTNENVHQLGYPYKYPYLYLVTTTKQNATFKKLSSSFAEQQVTGGSAISEYCLIDIDNYPPLFHTFTETNYDSSYGYKYSYCTFKIDTTNWSYDSSGSIYSITLPLLKGDTCLCNAGIISYTNSTVTKSCDNVKSLNITSDGTYTLKCNTYDAFSKPDFIVKTKNGSLLHLGITIDTANNKLIAYLQKGMKVGDETIQTNGYNELTLGSRIDITL